jgi:predicted dehydrogenase
VAPSPVSGHDGAVPRWGIAATGGIAASFAQALHETEGAELVAVCSRTQERADAFAREHGIARAHGSYEALAGDAEVDVVYVATPHSRHCSDAIRYLEAGKHVLCEKPLAVDQRAAARMVATARANDRFLMEAIWSRFLPAYRELGRILSEGRIGEVRMVEADFGFAARFDPEHRLFAPELAGGAMLDLGIYPVQLAHLVLGPPDEVRAVGHRGTTGVDELAAAVLHHQGGAVSVLKAAISTSMSCTATITGTEGSILLPAFMHCPGWITLRSSAGEERIDTPIEGQGLRYQVPEVQRCIAEGLIESPMMSHTQTCEIAGTLDAVLGQIG